MSFIIRVILLGYIVSSFLSATNFVGFVFGNEGLACDFVDGCAFVDSRNGFVVMDDFEDFEDFEDFDDFDEEVDFEVERNLQI